MYYITVCPSPVGRITLASNGSHLTGLWLEGQKYFAAGLSGAAAEEAPLPVFDDARAWLERYFSGMRPSPVELPLAPAGSAFRQLIWSLLLEIPYGETMTYGALARQAARRLGRPSMSAQAVGGAAGHNPISIIIPCHRLLGANGSLTGYAAGTDVKARLLALESGCTTEALPPMPAAAACPPGEPVGWSFPARSAID